MTNPAISFLFKLDFGDHAIDRLIPNQYITLEVKFIHCRWTPAFGGDTYLIAILIDDIGTYDHLGSTDQVIDIPFKIPLVTCENFKIDF